MGKWRIATAANSDYFHSLLTLITTNFHRHDPNLEIDVWDLGLTQAQRSLLSIPLKQKITLRSTDELGKPPFKNAFTIHPRSFTWKPWIIRHTLREGSNTLWLDAGVAVVNSLKTVFENIENQGYIFYKNNDYDNLTFTSKECARIMEATSQELFAPQIHGNILGFQSSGDTLELIDRWCAFMGQPKVAISEEQSHRHDQSVLSILAARNGLMVSDGNEFIAENQHFQIAVDTQKIFLAHRRKFSWIDFNSIIDV
jgi:hypothetical protein